MATEIELKLLVSLETLRKVPALAAVRSRKSGRARNLKLVTRYFDTPDEALRRAGMALRLRREGARWLQAVKSRGGSVAGLESRGEWEVPVAGPGLSLEAFKATPAFKLLGARGFKALAPVFETDFARTLIPLAFADGSTAELCLDQGRIKSGGRSAPLCEIELELKQGRAERLFELAGELAEVVPLRIGRASKAERGQALAARRAAQPVKAAPSRLDKRMQAAEALLALVEDCAGHLLANQEGVLAGRDPEFLHQARVALRRMRSALTVFDGAVDLHLPAAVADLIATAGNTLGAARDWDVFWLGTVRPFAAAFPEDAEVAALARKAARLRAAHARAAREFLASAACVQGLLGLGRFLAAPATSSSPAALPVPAGQPGNALPRLAAQLLQSAHRRVRKKGRELQPYLGQGDGVDQALSATGDAGAVPYAELHRLRIRTKKLRYAAEFFAPLFEGRRCREYARSLAALQEALGGLNDCATAERLLAELSIDAESKALTLARAQGWLAAKRGSHLDDLPRVWAQFSAQPRFWKKQLPEPVIAAESTTEAMTGSPDCAPSAPPSDPADKAGA